jgi:hypothetical protein
MTPTPKEEEILELFYAFSPSKKDIQKGTDTSIAELAAMADVSPEEFAAVVDKLFNEGYIPDLQ